ncbi:integrase/recombinase XerC [Soonwooa buanensis]|uniref:Integrase/recombinase XerC n=1 Tax=Soonwooa buanensis TaxID=619805 RepID=A0A1T5FH06_9FLAO|nr:tyrosine-type recombinase/integrase [Soonwooa buanensis]SKB95445.1 integrase/recombinase XerC [Soonwooa buanensis]
MLEKFLDYIRIEKRYSVHTITSYQKDLEDFASFVLETEATADLRGVNKKVIRNFIVQLSENKLSKRSINRKLSSLRGFYVYLLRIGEITVSPMESISSLKFYAEKQQAFSQDEMTMLQEKTENKSAMSLLEKLIIETLYQTGMRKAELCNLLFENVDFSKSEFKIIGKGNKQRVVPISERLHRDLQNYAEVRRPDEENKTYFFVNKKGKKLGERFVYSVVNKYLSLVTTKEKRSPHILRHSFATHVLNNGAEISKVKKILGHSSLASTQVYTEANIEELKKVFNKAHPRALKK